MATQLPLAGIRVCDFTWVGAGSLATKVLADYGAEVIKIETSTRPDVLRLTPPFRDGRRGLNRSGYFANRNTSKKSIAINLAKPEAVSLVKRLIAVSDVVANNFSPGTMERWGLGYEQCREIKPDIIYLSMPMYGATGPRSTFVGFGLGIAALTGLMAQTAYPGGPPLGTGTNYPDHCPNPYHAAVAVLAALIHRRRTGKGQSIELSQVESTIAVLGPLVLAASVEGESRPPLGNGSEEAAPHGVYPCAGEDRWIAIACRREEEWQALAALVPQLGADPGFATFQDRRRNKERLDSVLGAWTREQEAYDLMQRLQAVGIPASVVQDARDLLTADPQLKHRGHWVHLEHPEMGTCVYDHPPARLSRTPARLASPAPLLGQHTREVLSRVLGMDEEEIHRLEAAEVLV